MNKPPSQINIAKNRINELFLQAGIQFNEYPKLSKRYVAIARKIAMRYTIRLTKEQKLKFCKKCNAYLVQGNNCTVRLSNKRMILHCLECNNIKRIIYK